MRWALRSLQLGAAAVVVAASTFFAFELDRFFVPKELVLHVVAVIVGLMLLRSITRAGFSRVDLLLIGFLLLGVLSALLATNHWLAMRGLAISASGLVLFWSARALREAGLARPLLGALALAVVLAAVTSLLQTYGVETQLFSENRAPGGTLGNRNFVAHIAAFGLPLLLLAALGARSRIGWMFSSAGVVIVTATLVLTRSRAAWLAFGAALLVFLTATLFSAPLRRSWRRLLVLAALAAGGVAAALLIPNTLQWRDDNPYLESVRRVAEYQEGSGRGRLVQYQRSLGLAVRHPLFGVGPGNWAVEYPAHVPASDPSLSDIDGGTTTNPWPSSDWVAWAAERGFPAVILLALALLGIAIGAIRQLRAAQEPDEALLAAALLGTLAGAAVTGLFDAVMLLAAPALLIWSTLGALYVPSAARPHRRFAIVVIITIALAALGAIRSASQLVAMQLYATQSDRASLVRAARIDPGNYRLRLRLARMGKRAQRCEHALAARDLFPNAAAAREVSRGCGELFRSNEFRLRR